MSGLLGAAAACMLGFFFSSLYATFLHLPRARLAWRPVAALCLAAAAGAALGAATLAQLPETGVRLFVAALALASGMHALTSAAAWTLIGVGLWFGYASWRGGGVG